MSKMKYSEITSQVLNQDTGELVTETTSKSWVISKDQEPFFLTYVNSISWIYGIKSIATIKVLYKLLELMEFNKGIVRISSEDRDRICTSLDISEVTFSKSLKQLKELGVLFGDKGFYEVSPSIYWKGDYKTRDHLMSSGFKFTIEPV